MAQRLKGFGSDESGAVALIMAAALIALLGLGALAVDFGYMASVQNDLKKATESAALSGADALGAGNDWSAAANAMLTANGQKLADCDVQNGYWSYLQKKFLTTKPTETPDPAQAIQVVAAKTVQLSFASIFGMNSKDLSATAVAVAKAKQTTWAILETSTGTVKISGAAIATGSVGVSSGGKLTMTGSASITEKAYLHTSATKSLDGSTSIQGGLQQNSGANDIVTAADNAAMTAYNTFKVLPRTLGPTSIALSGVATATYTGGATQNVLVLTKLTLGNSAVLTLSAPAAGSFVIVDSGALTLSGAAKLVLQGGLKAENVTFVNTGTSTVTIGNSCIMSGNILSPNGAISFSGAALYNGTMVSGKAITLSGSVTGLMTPWLPGPGGSGQGAALVE
jgi:Flp pilus assembly protein TadG